MPPPARAWTGSDMAGKSSRFSVAVHILTLLAHEQGRALTSEYIAGSVNTNPVVIRRMLGLLSKAALESEMDKVTVADALMGIRSPTRR
jgi:Iron-dependent Transcriptional regulator